MYVYRRALKTGSEDAG